MRRLASLVLVLTCAFLTSCKADDFMRGRVTATGTATAQAFRVKDGIEEPITDAYTLSGQGSATAQTIKPYLTLDGSWSRTPTAARAVEEPGAVLLRPAVVAGALPTACAPAYAAPRAAGPCAPAPQYAPPPPVTYVAVPAAGACATGVCAVPQAGGPPTLRAAMGLPPPPSAPQVAGAALAIPVHAVDCALQFVKCLFLIP